MKQNDHLEVHQDFPRFYRRVFLWCVLLEGVSFAFTFGLVAWFKHLRDQNAGANLGELWICAAIAFVLIKFLFGKIFFSGLVDWFPIWKKYGYKVCPESLSKILTFLTNLLALAGEWLIAYLILYI